MAEIASIGSNATQVQRGVFLPTKILENGLLGYDANGNSGTSEAHLCFVQQRFSANLQAWMVGYVISISGAYSVYA